MVDDAVAGHRLLGDLQTCGSNSSSSCTVFDAGHVIKKLTLPQNCSRHCSISPPPQWGANLTLGRHNAQGSVSVGQSPGTP